MYYAVTIATLVTPLDCGTCHEKESEETRNSYHATAGQILDSKDAYLAHVAAGEGLRQHAAMLGHEVEVVHGARDVEIGVRVEAVDETDPLMTKVAFDLEIRFEAVA